MSAARRPRRVTEPAAERRADRGHSGGGVRHGATRAATLTGSIEDYLKAIYELERADGVAATSEIAKRLGFAPPSVTGMVRRLAALELITHERYRGVTLTASGRRAALGMLRRHRIIEAYLSRALGYPWDRVHDEAERLEHAASDELIDRMATAIGEPAVDPHGSPIPTREGALREVPQRMLAEQPVGERTRVSSVSDDDPEMLRYCATLAIRPGATVTVVERAPFDGPIVVEVGGTAGKPGVRHAVGSTLARAVYVDAARAGRRSAARGGGRPAR